MKSPLWRVIFLHDKVEDKVQYICMIALLFILVRCLLLVTVSCTSILTSLIVTILLEVMVETVKKSFNLHFKILECILVTIVCF